mmetsp:Transcript_81916/g.163100  ORF Transcript_81916/g.163100 Transcript_81916/m.163100 type:complete len:208 (-) Transcript_81916:1298-1921(-)
MATGGALVSPLVEQRVDSLAAEARWLQFLCIRVRSRTDGQREKVHLLLPRDGHPVGRQPLESKARQLVRAERLGLLGKCKEAVGLRDTKWRRVAQQLGQQGAGDVEDRVGRESGEGLISVLVDGMVSVVLLRCAPAALKLLDRLLRGPLGRSRERLTGEGPQVVASVVVAVLEHSIVCERAQHLKRALAVASLLEGLLGLDEAVLID